MQSVGQLAVRVKALEPGEPLGKAAEAVRVSTVGAVPLIHYGVILGLVTSDRIAEVLAEVSPEVAAGLAVDAVDLERSISLPDGLAAAEALWFLRSNDLDCAPVVDARGILLGMVSTAQLVSAICGRVRPPLIGGMATPFGVYLTGGGVRGGVGDFALFTTGVYLSVLNFGAYWLSKVILRDTSWLQAVPAAGELLHRISPDMVWLALFALMFRLSWVTGYHAAEHQVVHTIEAGDELRPEIVRAKPRVHPRCGTNLVAAVMIMSFFWYKVSREWSDPMLAMMVTFFLWRRVGGWLQQYVTTRPASPRQLQSGIRAGEELMQRYQERPVAHLPLWRRVWNMGLLQVVGGSMTVLGTLWILSWFLPLPPELRVF